MEGALISLMSASTHPLTYRKFIPDKYSKKQKQNKTKKQLI
jgi:hypothetical protein